MDYELLYSFANCIQKHLHVSVFYRVDVVLRFELKVYDHKVLLDETKYT